MKILTLSYEFPPIGGGGAGVVKGLAREMVRLGHSVDVVTMGFRDLPAEEVVEGIRVRRVPSDRRSESKCTAREAAQYVLRARPVVRELLARNGYDLVHTHFIFPDGVLALSEARRRNLPYILTAHGSDVPGYNPKPFFKLVHPVLTLLWRRVTRSAAVIVSPSRILAGMIESMRPGTPVIVIPNGMDLAGFRPQPKRPQALVATRLVERKGVQYLLKAAAAARSEWPTLVVGSGEYEQPLRELNAALGEPGRFLGWMSNESAEFRDLLATSAVYVLPSDFENFPVALLEALAAGSAIITTRGHGCEEVVGDAAELVTPGSTDPARCVSEITQALQRLERDPGYCAELGARARRRAEQHFAWEAVAQRYLEVYRRHAGSGLRPEAAPAVGV